MHPAAAALGAYSADTDAPAENSPICTREKSKSARSCTVSIRPPNSTFFPAERLAHFSDFYAARVDDSWYIDALGVDAAYRRRGVASRLVALTAARAREHDCRALSLIVFVDNTPALALYRRLGFETVRPVRLEANRWIPHRGGCLLMRRDLPEQPPKPAAGHPCSDP